MRVKARRVVSAFGGAAVLVLASAAAAPETQGAAATSSVSYQGFVIEGGPAYDGNLSHSPANWIAAVKASAQSGGQPQVYDPTTNSYRPDVAGVGAAPSASAGSVQPNDVASGYELPGGTRTGAYLWKQNGATQLGVTAQPSGDIVAEVNIKFNEELEGNTSDQWRYIFSLNYVEGGLWRLTVPYRCAVNETGKPDDYCENITYPDGSKDQNLTRPFTTEVHDLATGSTVQQNISAFFGSHSTPPPSGSAKVKKYAQLTEQAYFSDYDVTDTAHIRTYDVCVPNRVTFSGVALCSSSGTGS